MVILPIALLLAILPTFAGESSSYERELESWRAAHEKKLRAENGWLSLVGRFPLVEGNNSFGTGRHNDVVFPPTLAGVGPDRLGSILVNQKTEKVTLRLSEGVEFLADGQTVRGERELDVHDTDWIGIGRFRFHIIARNNKFFLRLADNQSSLRQDFPGCIWYPGDERFRIQASFHLYPPGTTFEVTNILDEVSEQDFVGYAEFQWEGLSFRLDAIREDNGLFFVFRDATAGDTTYPPARFLTVDDWSENSEQLVLDFNKAVNPPCAVSSFTTCPTAPKQNILNFRIEAGEKYRKPQ